MTQPLELWFEGVAQVGDAAVEPANGELVERSSARGVEVVDPSGEVVRNGLAVFFPCLFRGGAALLEFGELAVGLAAVTSTRCGRGEGVLGGGKLTSGVVELARGMPGGRVGVGPGAVAEVGELPGELAAVRWLAARA